MSIHEAHRSVNVPRLHTLLLPPLHRRFLVSSWIAGLRNSSEQLEGDRNAVPPEIYKLSGHGWHLQSAVLGAGLDMLNRA